VSQVEEARAAGPFVKIDYVSTVNAVVAQAVLDASSLQAIPAAGSPHTGFPSRPEGRHIMKKIPLQLAAAALLALAGGAAQAQVSVGASVNINVPGVYGRVDIGAPAAGVAFVAPPVVYAQPVVIAPSRVAIHQRPIYLYVPEAHQRDWAHHCAAYGACGQPVYFVREQWVHDRYVEHYPHDHRYDHWDREHGYGPGPQHGPERGHEHDHDDHDDRDHDRR